MRLPTPVLVSDPFFDLIGQRVAIPRGEGMKNKKIVKENARNAARKARTQGKGYDKRAYDGSAEARDD